MKGNSVPEALPEHTRSVRAAAAFWACLALLVLLWLLPATRWAVDGQSRRAFDRIDWPALGLKQDDSAVASMYPDFYDRPASGATRDAELSRAIDPVRSFKLGPIRSAASRHWDDALFLSAYLLVACERAPIPSQRLSRWHTREDIEKHRTRFRADWLKMRGVCDQGILLEPKNAFYPAVAAAVADATGDRKAAYAYLALAGACPTWNDHAADLTAILRRTRRLEFGCRGWDAWRILNIGPDLWKKDLNSLAVSVAAAPADEAGIQARRDLIHVAELAYKTDGSAYGDRSAAAGASAIVKGLATYGPPEDDDKLTVRRERLQQRVSELSRLVSPKAAETTERRLREILTAGDFAYLRNNPKYNLPPDTYQNSGDVISVPITEYGVGAMIVAALTALLVLILVSGIALRLPRAALPLPMMPGLAAGMCFFASLPFLGWREFDGLWIVAEIGVFYLLLGGLALFDRLRQPTWLAGTLLPPAALVYVVLHPVGGHSFELALVPIGLFVALLIRQRVRHGKGPSVFFLAPLLCVALLGLLSIPLLGPFLSVPGAVLAYVMTVLTLLVLIAAWQCSPLAEAARQARRYACGLAAFSALAFSGAVVWQVVADRHGLSILRQEESLSPVIRKCAREHPDAALSQLKEDDAKGITHNGWP